LAKYVSSAGETRAREARVRKLVAAALEEGLPLEDEPFAVLASRLGIAESLVVDIAREMLNSGRMRRFGPFFDFRAFGLKGYLFGAGGSAEAEGKIISRLMGMKNVTHVYGRKHRLRVWFTALLGGDGEALGICETLRSAGCGFVALGEARMIKLRPSFVSRGEAAIPRRELNRAAPAAVLDEYLIETARALQNGIGISSRPFDAAAAENGTDAGELLEGARRLVEKGVLRRIGASFNHYRAGWTENSLCAFDLSGTDEDTASETAIRAVSRKSWVSHCYIRNPLDCEIEGEWPYNLYIMIHASSRKMLEAREAELRGKLPVDFAPLRTEIEYKKTYYTI
jgi:DNA-binding Lrp family transcriptional regulator